MNSEISNEEIIGSAIAEVAEIVGSVDESAGSAVEEAAEEGEKVACCHCGEYVDPDRIAGDYRGDPLCQTCYENDFFTCEHCDEIFHVDDMNGVGDAIMCQDCLDEHYYYCDDCSDYVLQDYAVDVNGRWLCQSCADDYYRCDSCGYYVHGGSAYFDDDSNAYCESCWEDRNRAGGIHGHGSKLAPVFHRAGEDAFDNMFFGMELEFEVGAKSRQEIAEEISDPDENDWYLEEDGSLTNGIEVITHPRTFQSWKEFFPVFEENVLRRARNNSCMAHDAGTCGIHIHTSLDAWEGPQLFRLFSLLYNAKNYEEILTITQRKRDRLNRWASLDIRDLGSRKYRILDKRSPFNTRYAALNITRNTLEIRIFNSSLRLDRVQKNIEFVYALYEYTKGKQRVSWKGLKSWICKNRKEVPALYDFMVKRSLIIVKQDLDLPQAA